MTAHLTPGEFGPAPTDVVGPVLFARGASADVLDLTALMTAPAEQTPPHVNVPGESNLAQPVLGFEGFGRKAWLYALSLPATASARYCVDGMDHFVAADYRGDLRAAYVSCNGREHGDAERDLAERNALWRHLAQRHRREPLHLLLHGGDQLYADEMLDSHEQLRRWAGRWPRGRRHLSFSAEAEAAAERWLFQAYERLLKAPEVAFLMRQVPSLMMWDDHDIMDGWGSLRAWRLDSPIGRGLFRVAVRMFRLFQRGLPAADEVPWLDDETPVGHTFAAHFPGLSVVAPDLRSQRRPKRVLAESGWEALSTALDSVPDNAHTLVMSSVPALGPRLSVVERLLQLWPRMQKYEDDLRDQWQSHAHRRSWTRFLESLIEHRRRAPVTVLSGEIHVATRGELETADGEIVHQLVASGIAHPPPPQWYAIGLGLLAGLGKNPVANALLTMYAIPGYRWRYVALRNYLLLSRRAGRWHAVWHFEGDGDTASLAITGEPMLRI